MRRVLVLGGTAWLGQEIARRAVRSGAEVTCLARGESGAAPDGVRFVRADRAVPGAYDELRGDWDEVIEIAYDIDLVESALDALADGARHWTLVSTVSVYLHNDEPGADETAELVEPVDLTRYGDAKVAVERATARRLGDRLLIARPGLVVGSSDPSDRFGYWMARLRRGGRVLVPTSAGRFVQVIDLADLAAWIVAAGTANVTGTINAVGDAQPFDAFLDQAREVAGYSGELVAADDEWLLENDVHYWAGPRSLPLWLPSEDTGFAQRSNTAFLAAGGQLSPLRETMERVLADEEARGLGRQRRAGLTSEAEQDLLGRVLS